MSQSQIAIMVSKETGIKFYAKDVNALNNLQNKTKWRGETKQQKLVVFLSGILSLEKNQFALTDKTFLEKQKEIRSIIEKAILAEFRAYKALPDLEKAKKIVEPYFYPNSSAFKRVHGILERNKKRNWMLIDELNPSTVKLISCEIVELNQKQAVVATKEYWLLVWVNGLSKVSDYIYEKEADQKYIVMKNPKTGIFQVAVNSYEPIEEKVLPKIFNEGVFDEVLEKDSVEIAKALRELIRVGGFDAALQILQKYSTQTKLHDILREVSGIQARLSEQLRLLNTEKISQENYFNKKKELVDSTLKLIEKI